MGRYDFQPSFYDIVDFGLKVKIDDCVPLAVDISQRATNLDIKSRWITNKPREDRIFKGQIRRNDYVNERGTYPAVFELSEKEWENSKVPEHVALRKEWQRMDKEKEKKWLKKLKQQGDDNSSVKSSKRKKGRKK